MAKTRTVGTDPVQLLADNEDRHAWAVIMPSSTLIAANTGRVHVGLGFIPSSVVDAPDSGLILRAGFQLGDQIEAGLKREVYKGAIWARGSAAGQVVQVDEQTTGAPISAAS